MRLITILIAILVSATSYAGHHKESESNAAKAKLFFTAFLAGDQKTAKSLAGDDFTFVFKGRTQISNQVQNKKDFFGNWSNNVIAKLVPNGFTKFDFVKSISEDDSVVWLVDGDAEGVNGRYNNEYVFVFEFSNGKILSIAEYNSDLLVATRLYKQKLVADE
jgi:ketosteroid isomerase-like protein